MNNVSPKLSKFDYLRMAEYRLDNTNMYFPLSAESQRFQFVVNDLKSNMTEAELTQYYTEKNAVATAAEREKERLAMIKAMNENRDKPSI